MSDLAVILGSDHGVALLDGTIPGLATGAGAALAAVRMRSGPKKPRIV